MKSRIIGLAATVMLVLNYFAPSVWAADHQGGQINIRWSTSNLVLSPSSFIEEEFIPLENKSFIDGAQFRWTNAFHMDFCWQGTSSLTNVGDRCGFVGVGSGSKNGNNYFGNFDFVLFNGTDFVISKSEPNIYCDQRGEPTYVGNVKTYYTSCWKGVVIQMGTPYILRVQWDPSNTSSDSNWWSATLTNKKTNESTTIGKIQAVGNMYQEQLASLQTVVFYSGEATPCDAVPTYDLRVSPPRNSTTSGSYISQWLANCVRAVSGPSTEIAGYYSIRLGGSDPGAREPGLVATPKPSTSSTPKPSPTKVETKTKPSSPIFSGIKISGNTLNINVNLNSSDPDMVYLIAPKLNNGVMEKQFAEINGDNAIWKINFDPKILTGTVPITFVSVKNGINSDETSIEYVLPKLIESAVGINKKPSIPTKVSSKLVGRELLVSANIRTTGSSAVTSAYFYSAALGINKAKAVKGDLLSNSAVFAITVPLDKLSKKIDLNVYSVNKIGTSDVATGSFSIPVAKSPAYKTNDQNLVTVICTKGQTIRTFASKTCPPGWKTK